LSPETFFAVYYTILANSTARVHVPLMKAIARQKTTFLLFLTFFQEFMQE
jgi:hypothetical protein